MSTGMGPVSTRLETEVRDQVRRQGLVVWLDVDDNYSSFVDNLAAARGDGKFPYEVVAYRGSHLHLVMSLDSIAGGVDKAQVLVHLPGFTEDSVRTTPLYELYASGSRFRKALATLVSEAAAGRVKTDDIEAFAGKSRYSLEDADRWLAQLIAGQDVGFAGQLTAKGLTVVVQELLGADEGAGALVVPENVDLLWNQLAAWTGMPSDWCPQHLRKTNPTGEEVAFAVSSWAMCVEYVADLQRAPVDVHLKPAVKLPPAVVKLCGELCVTLRGERHSAFYQRTADEAEAVIDAEVEAARAEDLGKIDTFRFEEEVILRAAIAALTSGDWKVAGDLATLRLDGGSFWVRSNPSRTSAWQLVAAAATLGRALDSAGASPGKGRDLDCLVDSYRTRGSAADRAHRHLEQRRLALLYPQLPQFEALRTCLDAVRLRWRDWADGWARDFNVACKEQGFLPSTDLQQRTLFDQVVKPLTTSSAPTALFVVDAFRYEMAEELRDALSEMKGTQLQLHPRLAELPSVTEVGMNVLAPVASSGRLRPLVKNGRIQGFSAGEFTVSNPDTRKRAMQERVGGGTCPWLTLEEVLGRDASSLKQAVSRARLVVVHSQEIDNAGEKGAGLAVFDHVIQRLRAAWRLLQEAGVRKFVFTADHGFLLLDDVVKSVQAHGRKIDPTRRYVISPVAADHTGEVRVSLADLGYEGTDEHLMFPDSTAVFDTGKRPVSFVHGGNSFQERVVPVLTAQHKYPVGGNTHAYTVEARAGEELAGMQCILGKVEIASTGVLDFGGKKEVELSLRAPEAVGMRTELCHMRGAARIAGGSLHVRVGEPFELFFRLLGTTDTRVRLEFVSPSGDAPLGTGAIDGRFAVTADRAARDTAPTKATEPSSVLWLDELADAGVRQVFAHLAAHGTVTEPEATKMLGSPRAYRKFAREFENHAAKAPFSIRIDVVSNVKRYVRIGVST